MYNVIMLNRVKEGISQEQAGQALQARLKLSPEKLQQILSRDKVMIKKGLDETKAKQYKAVIEKCGFECIVQSAASPQEQVSATEQPPEEQRASETGGASPVQENVALDPAAVSPEEALNKPSVTMKRDAIDASEAETQKHSAVTHSGELSLSDVSDAADSQAAAQDTTEAPEQAEQPTIEAPDGSGFEMVPIDKPGGEELDPEEQEEKEQLNQGNFIRPTNRSTSGDAPAAKKTFTLTKKHIVGIVVFAVIVLIGLIGYFVALPMYQEKMLIEKVAVAVSEQEQLKDKTNAYIMRTGLIPSSNEDAGIAVVKQSELIQSLKISANGLVVATFIPIDDSGTNYTLEYAPEYASNEGEISGIQWSCQYGTMPNIYRPAHCLLAGGIEVQAANIVRDSVAKIKKSYSSDVSGVAIRVPASWRQNVAANDEASINVGHLGVEAFAVVTEETVEESKETGLFDLQMYGDTLMKYYLDDAFKNAEQKQSDKISNAEGVEGLLYEFSAVDNGVQVNFFIGFYELSGYYVQVMTWTLTSNYYQNRPVLLDIIASVTAPKVEGEVKAEAEVDVEPEVEAEAETPAVDVEEGSGLKQEPDVEKASEESQEA